MLKRKKSGLCHVFNPHFVYSVLVVTTLVIKNEEILIGLFKVGSSMGGQFKSGGELRQVLSQCGTIASFEVRLG
jgi:hypothetical protein